MTSNVPLVRPSFPPIEAFAHLWEAATMASHQFSNFGTLWHDAADLLSKMTGRIALPCSNGTEAVALAVHALGVNQVAFEGFTFEATRIACRRLDIQPTVLRTNAGDETYDELAIVRTIPFGSKRRFVESRPGKNLVIDAAGAFGGDFFASLPDDAFIACSFHATKNFPIGEGGCVFLPAHANWAIESVTAAMNFGIDGKRNLLPGYRTNAKLDEMRCAILLAQLERVDYFARRSARIVRHSQDIANGGCGAWLPYRPGDAQSLVVVAYKDPDVLVRGLADAGFTARRVYHPYVKESVLFYDEARLVALPSDMSDDELTKIIATMKGIAKCNGYI